MLPIISHLSPVVVLANVYHDTTIVNGFTDFNIFVLNAYCLTIKGLSSISGFLFLLQDSDFTFILVEYNLS